MRALAMMVCGLAALPPAAPQGFGNLFEKAPPHIDTALRERIDLFYKAHLAQDWAKALQLVHPEAVNIFIGAEKAAFRGFKIVSINYEENFTVAKAVIDLDTEFYFPGFGKMDVHRPLTSTWKYEKDQWWWFAVPFNPAVGMEGPFGMRHKGSGAAEPSRDIGKLIQAAPTLKDIQSRVNADRTEVTLSSHVPSTDSVNILNRFDGPVHLTLDVDDLPCLEAKIDKPVVKPGESARITFSCKPDNPAKKPDGRARVTVEEIAKVIQIQVNFAYPPNDPAPAKSVVSPK